MVRILFLAAMLSSCSFASANVLSRVRDLCLNQLSIHSSNAVAIQAPATPSPFTSESFFALLQEQVLEPLKVLETQLNWFATTSRIRAFVIQNYRYSPYWKLELALLRMKLTLIGVAGNGLTPSALTSLFAALGVEESDASDPVTVYFRQNPRDLHKYLFLCTSFMNALDLMIAQYPNSATERLAAHVNNIREMMAGIARRYPAYLMIDGRGKILPIAPPELAPQLRR